MWVSNFADVGFGHREREQEAARCRCCSVDRGLSAGVKIPLAEWQFPDRRRAIGFWAALDTSETDRRFLRSETPDESEGDGCR